MYKYEKRYKYPHLAPNDVAIWERFLDAYPNRYSEVDYDFALGSVPSFSSQNYSGMDGNFTRLYQKRLDVIAQQGDETEIIEIKPNAGASALGQLVSYKELYLAYVNPEAKVKCVLITDRLLPDMPMLAERMGVELVIV